MYPRMAHCRSTPPPCGNPSTRPVRSARPRSTPGSPSSRASRPPSSSPCSSQAVLRQYLGERIGANNTRNYHKML